MNEFLWVISIYIKYPSFIPKIYVRECLYFVPLNFQIFNTYSMLLPKSAIDLMILQWFHILQINIEGLAIWCFFVRNQIIPLSLNSRLLLNGRLNLDYFQLHSKFLVYYSLVWLSFITLLIEFFWFFNCFLKFFILLRQLNSFLKVTIIAFVLH